MLSFVGFLSCMLVLSIALDSVEPLAVGGAGGVRIHALLDTADENTMSREVLRVKRVPVEEDPDPYDAILDDFEPQYDDIDVNEYEELEDDRSNREWKKIQRYIKRQLKVPKRYLKKIVRKIGVTSLRSIDGSSDGSSRTLSLVSTDDSDELYRILASSNGRFVNKRLLFKDTPDSEDEFIEIIVT